MKVAGSSSENEDRGVIAAKKEVIKEEEKVAPTCQDGGTTMSALGGIVCRKIFQFGVDPR